MEFSDIIELPPTQALKAGGLNASMIFAGGVVGFILRRASVSLLWLVYFLGVAFLLPAALGLAAWMLTGNGFLNDWVSPSLLAWFAGIAIAFCIGWCGTRLAIGSVSKLSGENQ